MHHPDATLTFFHSRRDITVQHKTLTAERWGQFSLAEQMANIGSEVGRALNWRAKGKADLAQHAVDRALELVDLSLAVGGSYPRLKEFARLREVLVDYFYGTNEYASTDALWRGYFDHFNYLARRDR